MFPNHYTSLARYSPRPSDLVRFISNAKTKSNRELYFCSFSPKVLFSDETHRDRFSTSLFHHHRHSLPGTTSRRAAPDHEGSGCTLPPVEKPPRHRTTAPDAIHSSHPWDPRYPGLSSHKDKTPACTSSAWVGYACSPGMESWRLPRPRGGRCTNGVCRSTTRFRNTPTAKSQLDPHACPCGHRKLLSSCTKNHRYTRTSASWGGHLSLTKFLPKPAIKPSKDPEAQRNPAVLIPALPPARIRSRGPQLTAGTSPAPPVQRERRFTSELKGSFS